MMGWGLFGVFGWVICEYVGYVGGGMLGSLCNVYLLSVDLFVGL